METISTTRLWTGRVMAGLAVLFLLVDGGMKAAHALPIQEGDPNLLGFQPEAMPTIGWILLVCTAIYLVPRLSLLGAVLLTGYLGGAIACHVRVDNPLFSHTLFPTYVAALIWGGLLLRRPGLSLLLPPREKVAAREAAAPVGALQAARR